MNIESMTSKELVETFNEAAKALGDTTVKKFRDKATAIRRTRKALAAVKEAQVKQEAGLAPKKKADKKAPKKAAEPKVEKPVVEKAEPVIKKSKFNFPVGAIKAYRVETKRGAIIELMKRPEGATVEEIQAAIGGSEKQVYENIRFVHFDVGYGMRQDAHGHIFLLEQSALDRLKEASVDSWRQMKITSKGISVLHDKGNRQEYSWMEIEVAPTNPLLVQG